LHNYVKEDIQQSIFLIKNDNNNFPSSSMPLTIDSSNFLNFVHKLQSHNSEHFNHNFQEFDCSQTHKVPETNSNYESDLCVMDINEKTEIEIQESNSHFNDHFAEREAFHLICSNSHYDSYPDLFNNLNSFENHLIVPIYTNIFPENRGTIANLSYNELPASIGHNYELLMEYSSNSFEESYKYVFDHSSCSYLMFTKKEIEVINNDDLKFENVETLHLPVMVMSGSHIPNLSSQPLCENVRDFNSENFRKNSHLQIYNDFNHLKTIPVYDSYDDQVLLNCHDHDCCSQVHDLTAFKLTRLVKTKHL
jgi:hypothetical protein